jgi:tRNA(Met) C34 N-acetyltransferase TmcA
MSLLKYLNQNITDNTPKSNYIEYSHIVGELKKQDKIDLLEYSYLNNFIKEPFLININWLFDILNNNTNDDEKIKITTSFPKLMQDKLEVNKNIYNDLINNKYLTFSYNQQKALKKLIKFLVDYKQKTFGLYGYAGTGKTTTLVEFVAYLLENKFIKSVTLSAPTNKAVNIIKSKFRHHLKRLARIEYDLSFDDLVAALEKRGLKVDFITIHKLLNYKNDFDTEGDKVFLRNGKTNLNDYDLVIIDECSMIPYMIINNIYDDIT